MFLGLLAYSTNKNIPDTQDDTFLRPFATICLGFSVSHYITTLWGLLDMPLDKNNRFNVKTTQHNTIQHNTAGNCRRCPIDYAYPK